MTELPGFVMMKTKVKLGQSGNILLSCGVTKKFKPTRMKINAPCPNFGLVDGLFMGSKNQKKKPNMLIGIMDMFAFSPIGYDCTLDLMSINITEEIVFTGKYTGLTPEVFKIGDNYDLEVSLWESRYLEGVNITV